MERNWKMKMWTSGPSNNVHTQRTPLQYRVTLHRATRTTRVKALDEIYKIYRLFSFFSFFFTARRDWGAIWKTNRRKSWVLGGSGAQAIHVELYKSDRHATKHTWFARHHEYRIHAEIWRTPRTENACFVALPVCPLWFCTHTHWDTNML